MTVAPSIEVLERAYLSTWCALETEVTDGCVFAANSGYTGRGNSVTVVDTAWLDAPAARISKLIDRAEDWYASRSMPPTFRLSPLGEGFRSILAGRGYEPWNAQSDVLTTVLHRQGSDVGRNDTAVSIEMTSRVDDAWFDIIERSAQERDIAAQMFAKVTGPSAFARAFLEGGPVATGQVMLAGEVAMIYGMFTTEAARGHGVAAGVVDALHDWAATNGATTAALQVMTTNATAQRLYARSGYELVYRYDYLRSGE